MSSENYIAWSVWLGVKSGGWEMRILPCLMWWIREMMEKGSSEVFHPGQLKTSKTIRRKSREQIFNLFNLLFCLFLITIFSIIS